MTETASSATDRLRHRLSGLAYGGDYNPEQWPAHTRAEDYALMAEAEVNLVTVGVFGWGRVEPARDRFDFSFYDQVLDELADHGITADLATMTASPPAWLATEHPEILPVTVDGTRLHPGGRQHFCPSSPIYRERAVLLAEQTAIRYKDHPALGLWHIGNEYGCHVAECYCDTSAIDFRRWLQTKYQSIDELNNAWTTEVWSQRYTTFEQIQPPRITPYVANPAQQLDYKRFSDDALLACYEAERRVLREHTPHIPLTTNFMAHFKPVNQHIWGPRTDIASLDGYPDPHDPKSHIAAGLAYDTVRGSRGGDPWMLMEQAAGAVSWRDHNGAKAAGLMRLSSWQAIAHGADAILFFQWRQSRGGSEKWHSAMLPHAGRDSRVFREITALGKELARVPELAGTRIHNDTAILLDWESWWALELDSHPSNRLRQLDRLLDCYEPLFTMGIGVDVIPPDADLTRYRLVFAPTLYLLRMRDGEDLSQWVADGGHLVTTFFSGIVDEHDRVHPGPYPAPLRDVLGLRIEEFLPAADEVSFAVQRPCMADKERDGGSAVLWHEDIVLEGADPELTLVTPTGPQPACTLHRYGNGTARHITTLLDRITMRMIVGRAAEDAGIHPIVKELPEGVQAAVRHSTTHRYLILLNHTPREQQIELPGKWGSCLDADALESDRITLAGHDVAVLANPR
ncbi:beta-galactosidase [Streptomyces sp. NPDC006458]|uniref:beta-galactosidase n=1 Tax=Streptomyces sp. NPDC006458 TaxID=3154302 RepID=UPI0033BC46DA